MCGPHKFRMDPTAINSEFIRVVKKSISIRILQYNNNNNNNIAYPVESNFLLLRPICNYGCIFHFVFAVFAKQMKEKVLVKISIENTGKNISWLQMGELPQKRFLKNDFTRFLWFIPCKACVRYREVIFVLHSHDHSHCLAVSTDVPLQFFCFCF